jgi:alpha-ketoglutarate-dependent taurine dioxygenase
MLDTKRGGIVRVRTGQQNVDLVRLEASGYLLIESSSDEDELEEMMLSIGGGLGRRASSALLDSPGEPEALAVHTEGLYAPNPPRYFLLGCVETARGGGETTIYDARAAAKLIASEHPELLATRMHYTSGHHNLSSVRPLVTADGSGRGDVLIFRQGPSGNECLLPPGWEEKSFYGYMGTVLDRSLILAHEWKPGNIVIVDNSVTLHGRRGFTGRRRMIRVRVDDPTL